MTSNRKTRVGCVFDATYLYAAKQLLGGNIDYAKLQAGACNFADGIFHSGFVVLKDMPNQKRFLGSLRAAGFSWFTDRNDPASPLWADVVARALLEVGSQVDVLVVALGDDRLAPILEFVADTHGVEIIVVGFRNNTGEDVLHTADDFRELDDSFIYRAKLPAESAG